MPDVARDEALLRLIQRSVEYWNSGELVSLSERFREDAVLFTPFARELDEAEDRWIHGRGPILAYLQGFRSEHPGFSIVDTFVDSRFYIAVLSDGTRSLGMVVEPNEEDATIKRLLLCRSLMRTGVP